MSILQLLSNELVILSAKNAFNPMRL